MALYGTGYSVPEDDWLEAYHRDMDAEHREAQEFARRERLDEKGLPHVIRCEDICECGGILCDRCAA